MSNFKSYTRQKLEQFFLIKETNHCEDLENWLNAAHIEVSDVEKRQLERLRMRLKKSAEAWNEEELKMRFVAPLLDLIDFDNKPYTLFFERALAAKYDDNLTLSGEVDFMIAAGKDEPIAPYFCFHEYKRERGKDRDPRGQLLSEMLAAQLLNENESVIYGTYINGRLWFFATLVGDKYCFSSSYDVTQSDKLHQIFQILNYLRTLIDLKINSNNS
jgi:hypothetical protein